MEKVVRKSDGEVFKVGDRVVEYGSNVIISIGKIEKLNDTDFIFTDESGMNVYNMDNMIKVPTEYVSKGKDLWKDK